MLSTGFEPAFAAIELPQTHAVDSAATSIGYIGNIRGMINESPIVRTRSIKTAKQCKNFGLRP